MPLTEVSVIDQITVDEFGNVNVRRSDRVLRDGVVIAQTYHRHVIAPGDDDSEEAPRVQALTKAAWTPDVVQGRLDRDEAQAQDKPRARPSG